MLRFNNTEDPVSPENSILSSSFPLLAQSIEEEVEPTNLEVDSNVSNDDVTDSPKDEDDNKIIQSSNFNILPTTKSIPEFHSPSRGARGPKPKIYPPQLQKCIDKVICFNLLKLNENLFSPLPLSTDSTSNKIYKLDGSTLKVLKVTDYKFNKNGKWCYVFWCCFVSCLLLVAG